MEHILKKKRNRGFTPTPIDTLPAKSRRKKLARYQLVSGFTIIELFISTFIIILISGILLSSYPAFRDKSSLSRLAREVSVAVREAQVFGLAVRDFPSGVGDFPPHGIHIQSGLLNEIILFADLPDSSGESNGVYDEGDGCGSGNSECLDRIRVVGANEVAGICVHKSGANPRPEDYDCDIEQLNVTFRRPNPEAVIIEDNINSRYNSARIILRSKKTPDEKVVRIWITGQISVE